MRAQDTKLKRGNLSGVILLALLLIIPYGYAAATGMADRGLTGLAAVHSAAESVYCQNGFTSHPLGGVSVAAILLVESVLLLAAVLVASTKWGAERLGAAGAMRNVPVGLRQNGWYVLALLVLVALPFFIAWQTGTSACTRGRAFFWQATLIDVFVLAMFAISYNLLFGFSGVVSFGHALFFGVGAYGVGLLMQHLNWPWWLAIVATLLIGVLIALITGIVGLRIKGLYFALFTLAFAQVFFLLASNRLLTNITGAEDGFTFDVPDWLNMNQNRLLFYYVTLIALAASFWLVRRLMHSPTGRVLSALRDNEGRAQMLGYNTFYFKQLAIVVAGVIASGAGVLRGLALKGTSPEVLSLNVTFDALLMTLVGGAGTFLGPVVGAFGLHLTEDALRDTVINLGNLEINLGERWALILGVLFILSVMVFPYGVVGTLTRWWSRWTHWKANRTTASGR